MRRVLASIAVAAAMACGGGSSSTPTTPATTPTTTPTAIPTPTPSPSPSPTPTPNPFAAACGTPLPRHEDSYGFNVKVQLEPSRIKKILNASPRVRNREYCEAAGIGPFTFCNTRREDEAQRVPCDHYASGMSDAGRPGPNWYQIVNGQKLRCGGAGIEGDAPNCRLKDENQYLVDITDGGWFQACGGKGTLGYCGDCVIDESTFGTIHDSPAGLCKDP